jgi:chromate reductase
MNILVIYGSLNQNSINKALAKTFATLAPPDMTVEVIGIEGFPLFSKELELQGAPQIVLDYKSKILAADGVIISTPEYNRSMPGSLKNALDWISRAEHPWHGKPVGVVGASDGIRGASFAQYDLKRILTYWDAQVLGQPEMFVGELDKKITDGLVTDEKTRVYISKYLEKFKAHVERFKK